MGSEAIEALANIAVIGPRINIRISAQNPMDYVSKYKISEEKLKQQHIADLQSTVVADYTNWHSKRADTLAFEANRFLKRLRSGLPLPEVFSAANTDAALMESG